MGYQNRKHLSFRALRTIRNILIIRTEKSEIGVGDFRAILMRLNVINMHSKNEYIYQSESIQALGTVLI